MPYASPGTNNQSYLDPAASGQRDNVAAALMNIAAPPPQTPSMTSGLSGMAAGHGADPAAAADAEHAADAAANGDAADAAARRTAAGGDGGTDAGHAGSEYAANGRRAAATASNGNAAARLLRWAHYSANRRRPTPPNPIDTARAATGTNVATAVANANLQNINQVTPGGSLTYSNSGNFAWTDPTTGQAYSIPQFTATQTLTPYGQATKTSTKPPNTIWPTSPTPNRPG